MQQHDYSCGAASLATILQYYFNHPVTEAKIIDDILAKLTDDKVEDRLKNGLTLLDLKNFVESKGYQGLGVRLDLKAISEFKGPIIVFLQKNEYRHFSVLKGVRSSRVYMADPSLGNISMSVGRFAEKWHGEALVVGKKGFGLPKTHGLRIELSEQNRNEIDSLRTFLYRSSDGT